jgi:FkbM family methyltransferase
MIEGRTMSTAKVKSDTAQQMKLFRLPNGLEVWNAPQSGAEINAFYREIFERRCYEKNGVAVKNDDVIFDIGANVGMFSLSLMNRFERLRIYCCEPVPTTYACLTRNVAASPTRDRHDVVMLDFAAGKVDGQTAIEFFPGAPGNSTMYSEEKHRDFVGLLDGVRWSDLWRTNKLRALLLAPGFPFRKRLLGPRFERAMAEGVSVTCRVRPLSDIIRDYDIGRIDLLKVDVEGAEMDVLAGIEDRHWPIIRQISMEIESSNKHRLAELKPRLRGLGFDRITVENMFGGDSSVGDHVPCNLYAVRA